MADAFDFITLSLRFGLEVAKAIIRFPLMTHSHRKEIVKSLMSNSARGQWTAGRLSQADTKTTKESTAEKRTIRG